MRRLLEILGKAWYVCYLRTQVLELSNLICKPKATNHYVILVLPSQYLNFSLLRWDKSTYIMVLVVGFNVEKAQQRS